MVQTTVYLVICSLLLGHFCVLGQYTPTGNPEAVRECGNLHHLDLHHFANSNAEYINSECAVNCTVDGKVLIPVKVNEGYPCPLNIHGVCRVGVCKVPPNPAHVSDPIRECGNLHGIDQHLLNSTGTKYTDDECRLHCDVGGVEISTDPINEGFSCPTNLKGTCSNGECITGHVTGATPPPTTPKPTTPKPTTPKPTTPKPTTPKPTTPKPTTPKPTTPKPTTPKPTTPKPTTPKPTTPKPPVNVPFDITSVTIGFLEGKLVKNNKPITGISICYKHDGSRKFDQKACKTFCTTATSSCYFEEHPFAKTGHFQMNVWDGTTSVADSVLSLGELFKRIVSSNHTIEHPTGQFKMHGAIPLEVFPEKGASNGHITIALDFTYADN